MADYVTVANLSLNKIGEPWRIGDPDEDSHPARTIRSAWDAVRTAVLRRGKFNFSLKRFELAAQAPSSPSYSSPYPYSNRFPLPAGCLRFVEVLGPADAIEDYRIEGGAVLANTTGPLFVRCVVDVVNVGFWDALFVEAFAARLGYEIADTLTADRGRKADCWAEYKSNIRDASGVDAKEDPPEAPYDSSWVTARYGASPGGPPNV